MLVIGGVLNPPDAYYVRDRLGEYKVDKAYITSHPNWFTSVGAIEVSDEYRHYYVLKADPPD